VGLGESVSCGRVWNGFEVEPETAAFAGSGFNAGAAAHALGGFADEGQANSSALVTFIELLEHFKNTLLVLRRDANAVVLEPEAHEAGTGWAD